MSSKAETLARRLLRENRKNGRSWRVIAREDFNDKINNTTLCRFAKSKGTWIPKDNSIQIVLGIKHAPQQKAKLIYDMSADELLYAFIHRQPMPKVAPCFKKAFKQLGYKNIRVRVGAR
jgi:hypothetical protein